LRGRGAAGGRALTLAVLAPLGLALAPPAPRQVEAAAAVSGRCAGLAPAPDANGFEHELVHLANRRRRAAGLAPLKSVEPLTQAALWFARDMALDDYVEHDSYDRIGYRLLRRCSFHARVGSYYAGASALGENLASGPETPLETIDGWMASRRHRAALLERGFWETGAGHWTADDGEHYWVQDFGRRPSVFPVVIDDESPRTGGADVRLYIYGQWAEMRLSNDGGPFTPWRRFSNELAWRLADGDGTRRVTVELRATGRQTTASDTIKVGFVR
jgi:uncharacterized protein YkwD